MRRFHFVKPSPKMMFTLLAVIAIVFAFFSSLPVKNAQAAGEPCRVVYTPNSWNSGFTAEIKVINDGTTAIQGWTLTYSYANGQQVTSSWNATVSQSGANVSASNPTSHWNGNIPANGGSVSFGVQGTHSGTNTAPTNFVLNGVACNGGTVVPTTAVPTTAVPPTTSVPPTTGVPPTTAVPTTAVPPTTSVPGACQVSYTANSWGSGFTAEIKITNNASSAIQGWTLVYSYANGQQVTSAWNATVSQSGANVSASNPTSHWNGNIPANGGSVSFGVQGTHSGTNTNPTNFVLNGVACNGGTVIPTTVTPTTVTPTTVTPTTVTPTGDAAVFRVDANGNITKDGEIFRVKGGSWFGLEGRHEPSNDPTNPSGAPMEQY
ncbi:MAG: cellulose binding domain-containing protein, partial [Chloroflexota bacterium]